MARGKEVATRECVCVCVGCDTFPGREREREGVENKERERKESAVERKSGNSKRPTVHNTSRYVYHPRPTPILITRENVY